MKQTQLLLDRGYTSHEHFNELGIIHMNGRLYDPILRRFLNADENIQDPYNTQNYNKYSYVFNNPLMYNDPDGEFVWWVPLAIAAVSQVSQAYYSNQPIAAGSFIKGVAISYASAAVSYGIGEIFSAGEVASALGKFTEVARHISHGVSGGLMSTIQGDNFGSGFMRGVFGSVGGSLSQSLVGNSFTGNLISGAILGGTSSELFGGNFWVGAFNGISSSVFNHFEHAPDNGYEPDGKGGFKKVNDLGGDTVDVIYIDGEAVGWTFVQSERSTNELDRGIRTYGYKKTSGGALIDPSGEIFVTFAGGELAVLGVRYLVGKAISKLPQILASSVTRYQSSLNMTAVKYGKIIGWGERQTPEAVKQTISVTENLTKSTVKKFRKQGLNYKWVESQLNKYNKAIEKGGIKLNNKQLPARKKLMEKILELW
nr:RHS repeat-associated core domain-containing protein [Empedobacter brevis]